MSQFTGSIAVRMPTDTTNTILSFTGTVSQLDAYIKGFDPRVIVEKINLEQFVSDDEMADWWFKNGNDPESDDQAARDQAQAVSSNYKCDSCGGDCSVCELA